MAITVTANETGTTFNGVLLTVKVLTQVAASPIGATAVQSSSVAAAHQASITTTQTGSRVYGALASAGSGTAFTANANTTLYANQQDSSNGLYTGSCRSTSATGTPGAISIGASLPSTAGGCGLLEILANGTITEDASSPAAIYSGTGSHTVTTASFTPPPGSLLVAMVAADASTATVIGVSDSSSLVWTQQVAAQTTGALYAGVWTAVVPGGGPAIPAVPQFGPDVFPPLSAAFGPATPFQPPVWSPPPPAVDYYTSTYTSLYGGPETPSFPLPALALPPGQFPPLSPAFGPATPFALSTGQPPPVYAITGPAPASAGLSVLTVVKPMAAGENILVAAGTGSSQTVASITDSQNNTYVPVGSVTNGSGNTAALWGAPTSAQPSRQVLPLRAGDTIRVNFSGVGSGAGAFAAACPSLTAADQAATATGTSTSPAVTTAPLTAATEIGVTVSFSGAAGLAPQSWAAGWSQLGTAQLGAGTAWLSWAWSWQSAPNPAVAGNTLGASVNWSIVTAGFAAGTAPAPVYPLRGPVAARQPLPPRGRAQSRAGTFTGAAATPAPLYPLHGPVRAWVPLPRRGQVARSAGTYAQTGPPVCPLRGPVTAQRPSQLRGGRSQGRAGTFTFTGVLSGAPVYPLRGPVRSWPPAPARGRCQTRAGVLIQSGPRVYPLHGPVTARRPGPFRAGRCMSFLLPPVAIPPPPFTIGILTARDTGPGGTSSVTSAQLTASTAALAALT